MGDQCQEQLLRGDEAHRCVLPDGHDDSEPHDDGAGFQWALAVDPDTGALSLRIPLDTQE